MSIRVLSEETINKIAAGEVVESPASVVKELVENAIDAKATSVAVEIKGGGFSLIRVSDDGIGMGRDDLILSMERHATSKITCLEDLNEIHSMGFRGEALASIGSISRLRITSAIQDAPMGSQIECTGGKLGKIEDAARERGTTIEVRSLFFNVPARKKFQKSAGASQAQIYKTLTKLALASPHCAFKYIVEGSTLFHSHIGTLEMTCKEVLGEAFLKEMKEVNFEKNRCLIKGRLGSPMDARKNRLGQYLFVNGRGVVCPEITRGVYEGYGTRIGTHEHPTFVLHLTLPPEWIDVNVHPQKREVRLREQLVIQEAVREGVLCALQGKKEVKREPPRIEPMKWEALPPLRFQEEKQGEIPTPTLNLEEVLEDLPVIGQFDHFLLIDGGMANFDIPCEDGMVLVDLKRAYSRLLFERLHSSGARQLQGLMIPVTLEFTPQECAQLILHLEEVKKMGVEMRPFGESCLIVDALSPEIEEKSLKPLMHALLEVLDLKTSEKEMQKKLALTVSRYARSQKKGWSLLEAKHLVKQLLKTESPYLCPNGKPTMVHLSHETLEGYFQKAR